LRYALSVLRSPHKNSESRIAAQGTDVQVSDTTGDAIKYQSRYQKKIK